MSQTAPISQPRYELLRELASGGMASVFIGRQRGAGGFVRLVAIKRMHPHVSADPSLAAAFLDEGRIASMLRHPHVVTVYDVDRSEQDGQLQLVMDYIEGTTLAHLMAKARRAGERVPRAVALRVAVEALRGLHAAHEQKSLEGVPLSIVHRDATPQNILLGVDGTARVTDFGIARAAERSVETMSRTLKGKLRYMAPEQVRCEPVDRRADVFAIGAVVYELVSGQRMYHGRTDAELIREAERAEIPPLSVVAPDTPEALVAIVARALSPDREHRFPTAASLADAIEAYAIEAREAATASDVACAVERAAGEELERRRRELADLMTGRAVLAGSETPPPLSTAAGDGVAAKSSTLTGASNGALARAPSRAPWVVLAIAAIAISGLVGALVVRRQSEPSAAAAVPSSSALPPAPTPAVAPAASTVRVRVLSKSRLSSIAAPGLVELRIDDGGASFGLPRSSEPVTLSVALASGRRLRESLTPEADTVIDLREGDAAKPDAPKRAIAAPRGGAPKPKDEGAATGLKPSPY